MPAFAIDATAVTAGQYADCVRAGACAAGARQVHIDGYGPEDQSFWSAFCTFGRPETADHPMNCVSWTEASAYCRWAGKRLLTEVEWDYAGHGSEGRLYPWGDDPPSPNHHNVCDAACVAMALARGRTFRSAHVGDDGYGATAPVGRFPAGASAFGVLDMAGNVAQWTATNVCEVRSDACPSDAYVVRGCPWYSPDLRCATFSARGSQPPDARVEGIGFRCAR